jgi:hypothetical protein
MVLDVAVDGLADVRDHANRLVSRPVTRGTR